jgi:ABC-2 type transport system ATP-binding protein
LVKDFGSIRAVDSVSFTVRPGEVLGFLGPNGAGKSTSMKMITGFIPPTEGTASIGGHDIRTDPLAAKRLLGYLPENGPLYEEMTVEEFLRLVGQLRGLRNESADEALNRVTRICHLERVQRQTIETLSKGFRQRVGLAQAIIHDPSCLILDEPTDGLDPNQKNEVRNLIKTMSADKAIILSTHILEEVEAMCSRVIIIANGKIIADDTPENLTKEASLDEVFRNLTNNQEMS